MARGPTRAHLAGVVPLGGTWLAAATTVTPARLLQDVGGLLPGLSRHHEVNLLLAGLRKEEQRESHRPGATDPRTQPRSRREVRVLLQHALGFPLTPSQRREAVASPQVDRIHKNLLPAN